jgi:integrase
VDRSNAALVFETLKRRKRGVYRAVPVPDRLLMHLGQLPACRSQKLWPWGRTTAWKIVKSTMRDAGIAEPLCKPKSLRHAFAVEAGQKGIPLNIVQRWLGHARIETTAIYANAIGEEERQLAVRVWRSFEPWFNLRPATTATTASKSR